MIAISEKTYSSILVYCCKVLVKIYQRLERICHNIKSIYLLSLFKKHGKECHLGASFSYHGLDGISVGDEFLVGSNFCLRAFREYCGQHFSSSDSTIHIGNHFYCGRDCYISSINQVVIGNCVTLASRVTIIDHNHGKRDFTDLDIPVLKRELSSSGPIQIEDNVWLCENVTVLGNVRIGKNSIIGASAVVTHDIPENSIAVGNPAKVVKTINL